MISLYLIRHAQSQMNTADHLIGGRSEGTLLSVEGHLQAARLGKRIQHLGPFDAVYTSLAVRAQETAKIALPNLKEFTALEDLCEINQGDWEGKTREECYTPEILAKLAIDNYTFRPPNGESQQDTEIRMMRFFNRVLETHEKENEHRKIVAFTHGYSIKCGLRGILNFDPQGTYRMQMENAAITELLYKKGHWRTIRINDAAHLEKDCFE